jgi:hypothetical protein
MTKITIELPAEFSFRRSDVPMTVKPDTFPKNILAELLLHGIVQKVGDAAAGLKDDPAKAREKMESVLAQLLEGDWRTSASGVDPMDYHRAATLAKLLAAKDKADKAWFGKQGGFLTESVEAVLTILAKQTDATKAAIEKAATESNAKAQAEAEKRRKEKEAAKASAAKLADAIDLKL